MEFAFPKITKGIITVSRAVLKLADNYFLKEFHELLQTHIQRIQLVDDPYYSLVSKGEGSYKEHAALIEALEAKDLNAATSAMRANWETTILVANSKAPSD